MNERYVDGGVAEKELVEIGEIIEIVDRMEKDLLYQGELITTLADRLEPVLPKEMKANRDDGVRESKVTPLGENLQVRLDMICNTNVRLCSILEDLEI